MEEGGGGGGEGWGAVWVDADERTRPQSDMRELPPGVKNYKRMRK